MDFLYHFQKLCHVETRRSILISLFSLFSFGKNSLSNGRNSSLVGVNNTEVYVLGNNDHLINGTIGEDESITNDFEQPIRGNSSINDTSSENVVVVDNDDLLIRQENSEARPSSTQVNGLDKNSSVGSGNVGSPGLVFYLYHLQRSPTLSLNSMTLLNSSVGSGQRSDSGFTLGNVGAPEVRVLCIPPAISPTLSLNSMTLPRDSEGNLSTSEEKQFGHLDINLTKIHQSNIKKGWAPRTSLSKISYEMMEHTLKIYIIKKEKKGWFMKVMEDNKQFVVSDPKKSHLFYMPFSPRMLQLTLYVRDSHKRNNLADYLKKYVDM
ncbi:hypothetical protein MKW92_013091, partial [Papaver armeniacum]